jgi:hypothetical protein
MMMMARSKFLTIGGLILVFWTTVCAENSKPGKNEVTNPRPAADDLLLSCRGNRTASEDPVCSR